MVMNVGRLARPDGETLLVREWLPDTPPKAVLQISHGMAEHCLRYDRFARALTRDGWAVYAHDHRGHGGTAHDPDKAGWFADLDGWNVVSEDLFAVHELARSRNTSIPIFLLGHSMGSVMSREFAIRWSRHIDGLVLSGNVLPPGPESRVAQQIARMQGRISGRRTPSQLLDKLGFSSYNKAFEPARTTVDWLSRDEDEVDAYIDDPWCGFVCSNSFYDDFLTGQYRVNDPGLIGLVQPDLPVLVTSGDADPAGGDGRVIDLLTAQYRTAGLSDVTGKSWPGARHEILNEINREDVTQYILEWLNSHIDTAGDKD